MRVTASCRVDVSVDTQRLQAATKSLDSQVNDIVRAVNKASLNGFVDDASVLRFDLDRHVCLPVLRVTLLANRLLTHATQKCGPHTMK